MIQRAMELMPEATYFVDGESRPDSIAISNGKRYQKVKG